MGVLAKLFGGTQAEALTVAEPFGQAIANWQRARIIGDQKKAEYILQIFSQTHLDPRNPLSILIPHDRNRLKTALISNQSLRIMGEERVVEVNGRQIGVAAALPSESAGVFSSSLVETDVLTAHRNGYLVLELGLARSVSGQKRPQYQHLATVLFEGKRRSANASKDRWLSMLPSELLAYFYQEAQPLEKGTAFEATEITNAPPAMSEERLEQAKIIGSASLRDKYQILSHLQRHQLVHFRSQNPADAGLPNS